LITIQDFMPWLRDAIERLRLSGWPREADELAAVASTAYTTSSEMCGEIGSAILRVHQRIEPQLPHEVAELLQRCLLEIRKVWPELR
jgi:hypothetical protein